MSAFRRSTVLTAVIALIGAVLTIPVVTPASAATPAPVSVVEQAASSTGTTLSPVANPANGVTSTADTAGVVPGVVAALAYTTDGSCPRSLPIGLSVRTDGPSGTVFTGSASCSKGVWTQAVTGGQGKVGGMTLPSYAFKGTRSYAAGHTSGNVVIRLGAAPHVVPEWTQSSYVVVVPVQGGFRSTVVLAASSATTARIKLTGPLLAGGFYRVTGRGSVAFAGVLVPLRGWYNSVGYPSITSSGAIQRSTVPTWSITGQGADGSVVGATIVTPRIAMTQKIPGVTGSATIRLTSAPHLISFGSLRVVDSGNWKVFAHGSNVSSWVPARTSHVVVRTDRLGGYLGVVAGRSLWALTAPATFTDGTVSTMGTLTLESAQRFRLRATSAIGRIFAQPELRTFTGGTDSILVNGGVTSGHISLRTTGELLLDLPDGWSSSTTFTIAPRASGSGWATVHSVDYVMRNVGSLLHFSGGLASDSVFSLVGSGTLRVAGTDVPFHGYFRSKGFVIGGTKLTAPDWSLSGSPGLAAGGRIALEGGASFTGGTLGFTGGHGAPDAVDPAPALALGASNVSAATATPATVAGQTLLQLTANDPFLLPVNFTYTDQNNWSISAAGTTAGNTFNPYTGLTIPETAFHGTASDVAGKQTWNVTVDAVTWIDMANGVTMSTSFSVSNTCPLVSHCPTSGGIFFGGKSSLTFSTSLPTVSATGAFLADKSWARWDGTSSPVTFNGITISDPTLTVWKGERDDEDPNLVMPDLSGHNGNGFGLEYCGSFHVSIPDVVTASTFGCVEWSKDGVVMGQINTGGPVSSGAYNGVSLNDTTLTGFAWSNLADDQDITLNGSAITLSEGQNYITANLGIPGKLMHDVGTGSSNDTTIAATGWFTLAGDFSLDGNVAVNMKSSGFTLDDITVHIGKTGHDFVLSLGAAATVAISGNHFPLNLYIGYEHSGDSTITVRMDTHGFASIQPNGLMDFTSLLSSGTFEPSNAALIDGTFDGSVPKHALKDAGFENATAQGNLVTNSDFETNISSELLPNGDLEDGSTGNLLDNGDAERTDILYNGDFESDGGSTLVGWSNLGNYSYAIGNDTASGAADSGTYAAWITNTAGSGTQTNTGLYQKIPWVPPVGTSISVSGWVRGDTASYTPFIVYLTQTGCSAGNYTTASPTVQVNNTAWVSSSVTATIQTGCTGMTITLDPTTAGGHVVVDAWSAVVGVSASSMNLPTVWRPHTDARFDSLASTPISVSTAGVTASTDFGGTIRSDGCSGWMLTPSTSSFGYASGDFDMSVKVRFPSGSSARDIADVGFWMNKASPHATGYYFRLQTANGDGGFQEFAANGINSYEPGSVRMPNVAQDVWYQVRLTAVSDTVTAYVTRMDTNAQVFVQTLTMSNNYPHSGVFGQFVDGACSSTGSRWDDLSVYSANGSSQVRIDQANAHTGTGYTVLKGTVANWSSQYSTGESPVVGSQYTYSAWVRSTGGNVSGQLVLDTDGGTYEQASLPFTATSAWQQVTVTLRMNQSGHTDLRPGFLSMSTTGIELQVDDQVLQQVPWRVYPDNVTNALTELTSSDAHGGSKSLELIDHNNGSTALFEYPASTNVSGPVYTYSAWIKSAYPVTGFLRMQEAGGATSVPFTATSTWTKYTVTRTSTGGVDPYLAIDINNGHQGQPLLVDDMSLTVSKIDATMTTALGAPPQAGVWTNQGANVIVKNDATTSHTGMGNLQIVPPGGTTKSSAYTVATTPAVGSSWTASMWIYTGSSNGVSTTLNLSTGLENRSTTVTATTSWKQISVTLPITKAGATVLTLAATNNNTGANGVRIDDVSLTLQGLAPTDPWVTSDSTGYTSYQVVANGANAHAGTDYLEVTEHNGTTFGAAYVDAATTATTGGTQELGFWAKAPSGSPQVKGVIRTLDANGATLESRSVTFGTGSAWSHYFLSMPITKAGAVTLRTEFDVTAGATVWIDDIDSRAVTNWSTSAASGTVVDEVVLNDSPGAAEGANYLALSVPTAGGTTTTIAKDTAGKAVSVVAGSSYELEAYVRSNSDQTFTNGATLSLTYGGTSSETAQESFDVTGAWTKVSMQFTATKNNTTISPKVSFNTAGVWYVDSISVIPVLIAQSDPWTVTDPSVTFGVYGDPTRAHDSSYGLLEMSRTGGNINGIQHGVAQAATVGQVYNATAWVRSSTGTAVNGSLKLSTVGGTAESAAASFTATTVWQLVSLRLPIAKSGHTSLSLVVLLGTAGVTLDVDDAVVQQNPWQVTSDSGGTATQTVLTDGANAQSGTGYLELLNTGSAGGDTYLDTTGSYPLASTWTSTVYVRSHTGAPVSGVLQFGPTGGALVSQSFTAGTDWTPVTASYTVSGSVPASLRTDIRVTTAGAGLDLDSATLDDGTPPADGVTTPLPHPNSGWTYLWDDAFGIPGSHLWAMTAQVQFVNDRPGLGVGATIYHDPTKSPNVMSGTDWIKGDMALNISKADPCFQFDFTTTGNSKISIAKGVFTATDFSMNFAPRGCTIGSYVVPKGASLSFDGGLGSASIHFDLSITTGADGPEFTENLGITDLVLGGITYKSVLLAIDLSTTKQSVSLAGDFILPMGNFSGSFNLSVNTSLLHMDGDVTVSNWTMAGGGFSVQDFNYHQSMDIPFGSGTCANLIAGASGHMTMAKRTSLQFAANFEIDCGKLQVLHFDYDYTHGGVTQKFNLDYNASTHILAGGSYFSFERSTSWKYWGHRYNRHPAFSISLSFSMDTTKPSSGTATLSGRVSVSGGDGSLSCTINGDGQDDYCRLHVHLSVGGGHTYDANW